MFVVQGKDSVDVSINEQWYRSGLSKCVEIANGSREMVDLQGRIDRLEA